MPEFLHPIWMMSQFISGHSTAADEMVICKLGTGNMLEYVDRHMGRFVVALFQCCQIL